MLNVLIASKYTLAPFKQQVDYCESAKIFRAGERTGAAKTGMGRACFPEL